MEDVFSSNNVNTEKTQFVGRTYKDQAVTFFLEDVQSIKELESLTTILGETVPERTRVTLYNGEIILLRRDLGNKSFNDLNVSRHLRDQKLQESKTDNAVKHHVPVVRTVPRESV
jgi:hypothetical protein